MVGLVEGKLRDMFSGAMWSLRKDYIGLVIRRTTSRPCPPSQGATNLESLLANA